MTNESAPIRILIADDQALVRRGMALMLSLEPDMQVVAQAADGLEAIEMARQHRPDVILMDLNMPRLNGVAATREITRLLPASHVLVLTTLDDDASVFDAVRAGAQAYLLKDASEQDVLETVRAVHRGESRMTPQIARKVMDEFRRIAPAAAEPAGIEAMPGDEPLTAKEEKILGLIAEGKSNRQIADTVFLAEGTVKNYVSRIMDKLHAKTRTELAVMSLRQRHGAV